MKITTAVVLSAILTSAVTLAVLWWPSKQQLGWLELDGHPVAVDGERVDDWRHANEVLARSAAQVEIELRKYTGRYRVEDVPVEICDREFVIDYCPADEPEHVERVVVRRHLPVQNLLWGGRLHPIGYARYEVVGERSRER